MRLFPFALSLPLLAAAALTLSACDDTTGLGDPLIAGDTVTLGAPSVAAESVPSALDVLSQNGDIGGGRFPERTTDADAWDVTLRVRNGALVLLPRGAAGVDSRRAGITEAITGVTFLGLDEAPPSGRFRTAEGVTLAQGSVYVIRSRVYSVGVGTCWQYSKIQPLELSVAAGTVRLAIATSERCQDPRLAAED